MLMRVGSSAVSSSPEYFGRIMGNNRISIYNNWKALALFDTFTMLGHDVPDWLRQNWIDNYFNMIYVSLLFNKLYLFRLNILFRKRLRKIDRLEREFRPAVFIDQPLVVEGAGAPQRAGAGIGPPVTVLPERNAGDPVV